MNEPLLPTHKEITEVIISGVKFIREDLTPPPAAIQLPDKRELIEKQDLSDFGMNLDDIYSHGEEIGFVNGANFMLEACKELNAVKGEALMNIKIGTVCSKCHMQLCVCGVKKVEPVKEFSGYIREACEHEWHWSNNAGTHFCGKCNATSVLGKETNTAFHSPEQPSEKKESDVEELQKFIYDDLGFRVVNGLSSRVIAEAIIYAGWKKEGK